MLRRHRAMLLCGVAAFFAYAYFYEAGGWNQNTRFDLVRALVEHRTIQIDEFADNSGDKAPSGDHVYADKAPGASFVAAPVVALTRAGMRLAGADPRSHVNLAWQSYAASLAAAALPGALAVMCVWYLARRKLGATARGATVVALAFGLGTPFWAWATIFYGHTLAAFCLLSAFLAAIAIDDSTGERGGDIRSGAVVGLFIGAAVFTEYPTAIPGCIIVLYALGAAWRGGASRFLRVAVAIGVCGGLFAAALGIYNFAAFGSPFHVSYASEEDSTVLASGFFGITTPHLAIVGQLLWGAYRGLLPLAPVLALVPIGWVIAIGSRKWRRVTLMAAAVFLVGFALNASYEHWEGGWSFGPRQLGPVLGFAALGLVPLWIKGGRALRVLITTLAVVGSAFSLIGVSTTAQPPGTPQFEHPMRDLLWPAFRDGQLSLNRQSYFDVRPAGEGAGLRDVGVEHAQWNLGEKVGLTGLPSLLPLGAVLIVTIGLALGTKD
jgi:hypothetical protein